MKLYELTGHYLEREEFAANGEIDEQTFTDTMESISEDIKCKADGYARVIRNLEANIEAYKNEEERLYSKRKTLENNIKRMKSNLQYCMCVTGEKKFKTELFSFNVKKGPKKLVVDKIEDVPEEFLIMQEPKVNTKALKEFVTDNEVSYAHLEQSESLAIR